MQVAVGGKRAESTRVMDAARASLLMLVSHACECGYDCDRRPRQPGARAPALAGGGPRRQP